MSKKHNRWAARHKVATALIVVAALAVGAVGGAYLRVGLATKDRIYPVGDAPSAPVAIVFGAGIWGDQPSPYLRARLQGAKDLWDAGKVQAILVSGDRSGPDHDEPTIMRTWLIDNGVPADVIVPDFAGYSTNDTCDRAHDVFGITRAIAVTQSYHVERAVFTCRRAGIDATGVGVVALGGLRPEYAVREVFSTINAAWGSFLKKTPTVLGPKNQGIQDVLRRAKDGT